MWKIAANVKLEVIYVNNQCLPWEEGELCSNSIFYPNFNHTYLCQMLSVTFSSKAKYIYCDWPPTQVQDSSISPLSMWNSSFGSKIMWDYCSTFFFKNSYCLTSCPLLTVSLFQTGNFFWAAPSPHQPSSAHPLHSGNFSPSTQQTQVFHARNFFHQQEQEPGQMGLLVLHSLQDGASAIFLEKEIIRKSFTLVELMWQDYDCRESVGGAE